MAEFKILDHATVLSLDPARKGKNDVVVTYALNGVRGYVIRLPEESASEAAILTAVRADIDKRGRLVGRTYSV